MDRKTMNTNNIPRKRRRGDRFLDRRSGEDRRKVYSLDYFFKDYPDRRKPVEQRGNKERRSGCVRVTEWSSVCPDINEFEDGHVFIIDSQE